MSSSEEQIVEATDARIIRLIEVAREIAADCETDALALDSTPFTPRGMGETFGQTLAMLGALAKVVATLADHVGASPPASVPSPPEPACKCGHSLADHTKDSPLGPLCDLCKCAGFKSSPGQAG